MFDFEVVRGFFQKYYENFLELLLPNHYTCFGCGVSDDFYASYLCQDCSSKLKKIGHCCRICGANISTYHSICEECRAQKPVEIFDCANSCFLYNDFAKDLLHRYKYLHQRYLAHLFADMLYKRIEEENLEFDLIVPVVSGSNRIRQRGFDHIEDICVELSKLTNRPAVKLLKRFHHDIPQMSKTKEQRWTGMEGSFIYQAHVFRKFAKDDNRAYRGLKILLVDDLYTTGATVRSAGFELGKYFKEISAITVFHAKSAL